MTDTLLSWPEPGIVLQELPVAYIEIDSRGVIRVINDAACRLHDLPAEQLVGREIWTLMPRDQIARSRADFFDAIESSADLPVARRSLLNAHHEFVTHEIHRRLLRDADGNAIGMSCVTFDVSELEAANHETRRAQLWLESVIQAIPQAIMVTDALGFVRCVNPAAERLLGWSATDLIGRQIEKGMPILSAISVSRKPLSFRMALEEPWNGDVKIVNRHGQSLSVWLSASPIVDQKSGSTNGVVIVLPSPDSREKPAP